MAAAHPGVRSVTAALTGHSEAVTSVAWSHPAKTAVRKAMSNVRCGSIEGLAVNSAYMADLDGEIAVTAGAYVGAAVTEIATFRAELSGPQVG